MDAPLFSNVEDFNPLRHPNWRWNRAMHVQWHGPDEWADDDLTLAAVEFKQLRLDSSQPMVPFLTPDQLAIKIALELTWMDCERGDLLKAWLLTGEPADAIAPRVGLPVEVVTTFEQLFFNVRDRLGTSYYIQQKILRGGFRSWDCLHWDRVLMTLAYYGGPLVLERACKTLPLTQSFDVWGSMPSLLGRNAANPSVWKPPESTSLPLVTMMLRHSQPVEGPQMDPELERERLWESLTEEERDFARKLDLILNVWQLPFEEETARKLLAVDSAGITFGGSVGSFPEENVCSQYVGELPKELLASRKTPFTTSTHSVTPQVA